MERRPYVFGGDGGLGAEWTRLPMVRPSWVGGVMAGPEFSNITHQPVLVSEVLEHLQPGPKRVLVDCTVGLGGHSVAIAPRLLPNGRLIALDCDAEALDRARARLTEFEPNVRFIHENFRYLPEVLKGLNITRVDGVLADVGVSSLQLDSAERGFSFQREGPLDMRMDQDAELTAEELLHHTPEHELVRLFETYGEERWSRRIAKRIVETRRKERIRTTTQLARLIAETVPSSRGRPSLHPATRVFQALRIVVNQELAALEALLAALPAVLAPGGRAVLISFHSLEDRLVKQAFRRGAQEGQYRVLTPKPLRPSDEELARNPRARSSRLRAIERIAEA